MEIAVIGAGAIGGVLGAYLTRSGEQVVFCDIVKEHVNFINGAGITIEGEENFTVQGQAYLPEDLVRRGKPLDMVFLCVKGQHTESALKHIMPLLTEHSAVVSFQNGLCENIISALIGKERTIGCFVNFSADYLEPGRILYGGVSSLFLGELDGTVSPRILDLQRRLACWGPVNVTDNIWGYLWGKLSYIALLYATALTDETMAAVVKNQILRETLIELCTEVLEVAEKENVSPMEFDDWVPRLVYPREQRNPVALHAQLDKLSERMAKNKKTKSGIWRDLAIRKRKTEVEFQLQPILDIGRKHGLTLPLVSRVARMTRELENGERAMGWENLYELKEIYEAMKR